MVVGGYNFDNEDLDDAEIVGLDGASACMKPNEYPTKSQGMVGTFVDGMALFCGGDPYTSDCFAYDFENEIWLPKGSMGSPRGYAGAVMLNDSHWWITGGSESFRRYLNTTELYNIAEDSFSPYVELPTAIDEHIVLKIDDTHFFFCCGVVWFGRSFFFDLETETWTEAPESQYDHREGFAGMLTKLLFYAFTNLFCLGLVTHSNGTKEIVITSSHDSVTLEKTEILNLDTMTWRAGPPLPTDDHTFDGSSLPYGNSFLAIGGYSLDYDQSNEIWYFNPDSYTWELMATMAEEREHPTAILLPDNAC